MTLTGQAVRKPSRAYIRRGHPLATDLAACWPAMEGAGTTLRDITNRQNGRNGVFQTNVQWRNGLFGPVTYRDRALANTVINTSWAGIGGSQNRSLFTVIKNDDTSITDDTIFGYGSGTGGRWDLRLDGSNGNVLRIEVTGGFKYGTTDLGDTDWHSIGVSLDGDNVTDHTLYVDGSEDGTGNSSSQSLNTDGSNDPVDIGNSAGAGGRGYDGSIGIIYIWNRALHASEFARLHADPFIPLITKPR